jgi:carnitine O-acetyltransferase
VADEIYGYSIKEGSTIPQTRFDRGAEIPKITELTWIIPNGMDAEMERTFSLFHDAILENETSTVDFTQFGGNFVKQSGMSPDGFAQIAMQLAHFMLFGKLCPTYESASTRLFLHGRTETVRSCTQEALDFCTLASTVPLLQDCAYREHYRLMKRAVDAHIEYMRQAKQATAVDRHLLGLRMTAKGFGMKCDLFEDPAFTNSSRWLLSTSHCGSPSLKLFGFGPVEREGYGIGYMIKTDRMMFNITSKYQHRSASVFGFMLQDALLKMRAIVLLNVKDDRPVSRSLSFHAKQPKRANQAL